MMCFSPADVQKVDDIKISRQFKESVIRPILKVKKKYTEILKKRKKKKHLVLV